MLITIRVENKGSERLDLDLGGDGKDNLVVSVTSPDGIRHEGKRAQPRGRTTFFGNVNLGTGERYSETIVLSEWFSFDQIGGYEIEIRMKSPLKIGERSASVGRFLLALAVTPKDSRVLLLSCENLLSRIRAEGLAQDALASVAALSMVRDPIVVPLWGQLLTSPAFGRTAASRLAEIGNKNAVEVLTAALHSTDAETQSLARAALFSIVSQTPDPSVRADAQDALGR